MLKIFPDLPTLFEAAATLFVESAALAMRERSVCRVALAGGSTPRGLYALLASDKYRGLVDWRRVRFFFGDERMVPPDDADSNYRMARETLFDPLAVAPEHVFRWKTELGATEAARDYGRTLAGEFPHDAGAAPLPRFDLALLGMGADGHTASLFPYTPALREIHETTSANPVGKLAATRLTLTFPVINNARAVVFLVGGADKAGVLREVLEGPKEIERLPSQSVAPASGGLFWLVDEAAAAELSTKR